MALDKENLFKEFVSKNNILIVDKNSAARSRLRMTLISAGVPQDNVYVTGDYHKAFEYIQENQPQLVLSDYLIKNGSGFDLFKEYKGHFPELKKIICILITNNVSQSIVAKAAEEDVDSFLIKPYTAKGLMANMKDAVASKIKPSPYVRKINAGKELLFNKDYEGAAAIFAEAEGMVSEPSLALFYHGQAQYLQQLTREAETDFKKGLEVNKIHFKCQVGLYEILRDQKRYEEAYDVVRALSKYFPANPDRLAEVIKLCIITKNYQDMIEYYEVFTSLDDRPEILKRHMAVGMYIAGKHYVLEKNIKTAQILFERVGVSFSDNYDVLDKIIFLLTDNKKHELAQDMLMRYPVGVPNSNYELLEYIVNSVNVEPSENIQKGLILFNSPKQDFRASVILLDALKANQDDILFEKYYSQAAELWPKIKRKFKNVA